MAGYAFDRLALIFALRSARDSGSWPQIINGALVTTHGVVVVDHLVYDVLDASDFSAAALTAGIGTLSTTAVLEVKTLVVTTQVLADLAAARTRSQFRVRWSIQDDDGDSTADNARFTDAEVVGNPPQLVVTYTLPYRSRDRQDRPALPV